MKEYDGKVSFLLIQNEFTSQCVSIVVSLAKHNFFLHFIMSTINFLLGLIDVYMA